MWWLASVLKDWKLLNNNRGKSQTDERKVKLVGLTVGTEHFSMKGMHHDIRMIFPMFEYFDYHRYVELTDAACTKLTQLNGRCGGEASLNFFHSSAK